MIRPRTLRSNHRQAAPEPATEAAQVACRRDDPREPPTLRFSPTAWAKLLYVRDLGDTEVGGFGITAADDLLHVDDVQLVRQVCTGASVAFDDESVADFFDQQVDAGRHVSCFARIWLHTHPGNSPEPSMLDDATFDRVFGRTNWAVMFILARGGQCYARLRFHVGPGGDVDLPVRVDYSQPFAASNHGAWEEEYAASVEIAEPSWLTQRDPLLPLDAAAALDPWDDEHWLWDWDRPAAGQQTPLDAPEVSYAI